MIDYNILKRMYRGAPSWMQRVYGSIPWDMRMGREYRKWMRFLDRSAAWSATRWRRYQRGELQKLLWFSYQYVPYYRRIMERRELNPLGDDPLRVLQQMPVITRGDVVGSEEQFHASTFPKWRTYSATTGGTTGRPIKMRYSRVSYKREWAFKIYHWNRAIGYRRADNKATFRGVGLDGAVYEENPVYNEVRYSPFAVDTEKVEEIIDHLRAYDPRFVHGYPSVLEVLAKKLDDRSAIFGSIKGIILISENIRESQKSIISQAFQAPCYSFYGHTERAAFASQCEYRDGYHVHPAYGIVEILNNRGERVGREAEHGKVVATGFINRAMPLIKYDTGDAAAVGGDCNCEMKTPVLQEIVGRWDQDWLVKDDGSVVSVTALNVHDELLRGVKKMQFLQREEGSVTLRIVPTNSWSSRETRRIEGRLQEKLGPGCTITVERVTTLKRTQAGKQPYVKQDLELAKYR